MQGCARRQVLTASGAMIAGVALVGCGGSADDEGAPAATDVGSGPGTDEGQDETQVASASEVPVGGGLIVQAAQVVLTQPTEGDFKAFSAICPHQGCPVSRVEEGAITCTCHGSSFDLATGDVLGGPARSGLSLKELRVDGDDIFVS